MASASRGLDVALAGTVTLAVDDVVMDELPRSYPRPPWLARSLVVGPSVYTLPPSTTLHCTGRSAGRSSVPPTPTRTARLERLAEASSEAGPASLDTLGLSAQEINSSRPIALEASPPLELPDGVENASAAALATGLLSPVTRGDGARLWYVHRCSSARAIAAMYPEEVRTSHAKAARFWLWRVPRVGGGKAQPLWQKIEARYHLHTAGDTDTAVEMTWPISNRLITLGHYGRAAELCRETLDWVSDDSYEAGVLYRGLAEVAYHHGDYESADRYFRRAIRVMDLVGDEEGLADGHTGLARLAGAGGDYSAAKAGYQQALNIRQRIGTYAAMADNYDSLGGIAQRCGDHENAERHYRYALEVAERVGHRMGVARSYPRSWERWHRTVVLPGCEDLYRRSLEIEEQLGHQAGMAASYGGLSESWLACVSTLKPRARTTTVHSRSTKT